MLVPITERADLGLNGVARYIQLATLFRRRIEAGHWPAGSQIPTIDELMEECGVARATIRQSIGLLEREGLVSRYRAKGTFVNEQIKDQLRIEMTTDWGGLLNAHADAQIEVLENELGGPPLVRPHDIGVVSSNYRRLKRLHRRKDQAYLVAEVFIEASLAEKLDPAAFDTTTAMRLASMIPGIRIGDAQQTLTIGTADFEVAALLNLPINAPTCQVDRSVLDARGRLILISKGTYRGDVVRMDAKLK